MDHVVSDVLQRGLATVEELVVETRAARAPGHRLAAGTPCGDAARGMRSVGESDLRRVVVAAGLPEPEWNAAVVTPAGTYFVDALLAGRAGWRPRPMAPSSTSSAADWCA